MEDSCLSQAIRQHRPPPEWWVRGLIFTHFCALSDRYVYNATPKHHGIARILIITFETRFSNWFKSPI